VNLLITVEVKVPDATDPQQVVDEITSNLESCDWTVVSTFHEIMEGAPNADD
jgi:hypothetical protein